MIPILRDIDKESGAQIVLTSAGESRVVFRREGADLFGADMFIEPEELVERREYLQKALMARICGKRRPPQAHSGDDLLELLAYDVILTHGRDLEYWPSGSYRARRAPRVGRGSLS